MEGKQPRDFLASPHPRLLVVSKFLNHGGVSEYAIRFAQACKVAGFDTELVALRAVSSESVKQVSGVRVSALLLGKAARRSIMLGLPLLRLFRSQGYSDDNAPDLLSWTFGLALSRRIRHADLVVYTDEVFGSFAQLATKLVPRPYAVVIHEGYEIKPRALIPLQTRLLSQAAGLFSPSPRASRMVETRTGLHVTQLVLTRPVDSPNQGRGLSVLFDTRWTPARRPSMILDIARIETRPHYVVTGSFPTREQERDFLKGIDAAGLSKSITVVTGISDEEIRELYAAALAYVRWGEKDASNSESGVGLGILKALESGCPVVVDKTMGGAELIVDGVHGFAVDPTPDSIAGRISYLVSDPASARFMGQQAWELARRLSGPEQADTLRRSIMRAVGGSVSP